jgi:hypothetical protein
MRVAILIASLFLITPASAQRPSTLAMSCGEARAIVATHGAIVLSTGPHLYNRYVARPASVILAIGLRGPMCQPLICGNASLAISANPMVSKWIERGLGAASPAPGVRNWIAHARGRLPGANNPSAARQCWRPVRSRGF